MDATVPGRGLPALIEAVRQGSKRRRRLSLLVVALLMVGLGQAPTAATDATEADCEEPHPCDYRWEGPVDPLEVLPVERVRVHSYDGVVLNGWVWRPAVPDGVTVPVVLVSTPYMAQGSVPSAPSSAGGTSGRRLVESGYAVAHFSVRGTGDSGGCQTFFGLPEQRDQVFLVEWLGAQPWSNGRVAMTGNSYVGTTPVQAAIQNPPSLKTIIISGTVTDFYSAFYSPQGAEYTAAQPFLHAFTASQSVPGVAPGDDTAEVAAVNLERACEDVVAFNTAFYEGRLTDVRAPEFMTQRRFIDGLPGVRAATFIVHGFQDRYGSVHAFQEDWAWEALGSAPKRMFVGQWWHEFPNNNSWRPELSMTDWPDRLLEWLDYWLKGWGDEAPGLGQVEFQDNTGAWYRTVQWPPPLIKGNGNAPPNSPTRRHDEVMYLADATIHSTPAEEQASFVSAPPLYTGGTKPHLGHPEDEIQSIESRSNTPCPDPTRLVYFTEPLTERTVLAGNPFAWLSLESTQPGGIVDVQVYDVAPTFSCPQLSFSGLRPLTEGAADLRFHDSTDYVGRDFPVGEPQHVRIDLANLAEVLEPGHRLAVVISIGSRYSKWAPGYAPVVTVHGDGSINASHLVLPVIAGGFGGSAPTLDYPPRPFTPEF